MTQIERRVYSPALDAELRRLAESEDLYKTAKPKATNIVGKRFGRLIVVRPVGHGSHGRLKVLVHCDCGDSKILLYDGLNNGTKSCGCLQTEKSIGVKAAQYQQIFRRMIRERKIGPTQADNALECGSEPAQKHNDLDTTQRPSVNTTKGRLEILDSFELPEIPDALRRFREREEERIRKDKERIERAKASALLHTEKRVTSDDLLEEMHKDNGLIFVRRTKEQKRARRLENWRDKAKRNKDWANHPDNALNQAINPFMDTLNSMTKISHRKESSNDDDI